MTKHGYIQQDQFGRDHIDLPALAADLAPLIGGELCDSEPGSCGHGTLQFDGFRLRVTNEQVGQTTKITARSFLRSTGEVDPYRFPDMPEANVSLSRGLEVIARDIARRVVAPAQAPAEVYAEELAKHRANRARLEQLVEEWRERFPGLYIKLPTDGRSLEASVYGGADAQTSFSGRLDASGGFYLDRASTAHGANAPALVAALIGTA